MGHATESGTFEGNDGEVRIHDGTVGSDGAAKNIGGVLQADYDHLCLLADSFTDANVAVGLHGQRGKADACCVNSQRLQLHMHPHWAQTAYLDMLLEANGELLGSHDAG